MSINEWVPHTPEPDMGQLQNALAQARGEADMTLEQLAEAAGLHRQTVALIHSGKAKGDLETWLKLSRALGVSLDELTAPVWHES